MMGIDAKTAASARKFAAEIMAEPDACSPELVDLAEHYLDLLSALNAIDALEVMEINPSNYDHELVCELSGNASQAACIARDAVNPKATP